MSTAEPNGETKRLSRRAIAAAATREEILRAARRLFVEHGYAGTSVVEIARAAGVSVPTIYASVGKKAEVVMALVDLAGKEAGAGRALAEVDRETEPARLIHLGVRVNRLLEERGGEVREGLRSAAYGNAAIRAALAEGERRHRAGARRIAKRLAELNALRGGLEVNGATDAIALLTDAECFARLRRYGWTFARAEAWIDAALCRLLLRR